MCTNARPAVLYWFFVSVIWIRPIYAAEINSIAIPWFWCVTVCIWMLITHLIWYLLLPHECLWRLWTNTNSLYWKDFKRLVSGYRRSTMVRYTCTCFPNLHFFSDSEVHILRICTACQFTILKYVLYYCYIHYTIICFMYVAVLLSGTFCIYF